MKKSSVVIPVYNEEKSIEELLRQVDSVELLSLEKEIIVVDDGSTDNTQIILKKFESKYKIFYNQNNMGKGSTLRKGFSYATGDYVLIQDADLEYDPREYSHLLSPLLEGRADVVFGSRFVGSKPHRVMYFWHYLGNRFLTTLSNLFCGLNLTDIEVGYKAFTRAALQKILPKLRSNRFGIEPEITARVAKAKLRVYEVGVSYYGRDYKEGKKVTWKDGLAAIWHIIRFNL